MDYHRFYFLSDYELGLESEMKDFKMFGIDNNLADNDGYIWSISIIRKFSKNFLQKLCWIHEIKYSSYDNKAKLIEKLFKDIF